MFAVVLATAVVNIPPFTAFIAFTNIFEDAVTGDFRIFLDELLNS